MLASEPPVVIMSHEVGAGAMLEVMYLQDENRLREVVLQAFQTAATGLSILET